MPGEGHSPAEAGPFVLYQEDGMYRSPDDRPIQVGLAAAGPGIFALVIGIFLLMGGVIAAVSSITAAAILVPLTRLLSPRNAPSYGEAYGASFSGIFAYLAVTFGISMLLDSYQHDTGHRWPVSQMLVASGPFITWASHHPREAFALWPEFLFTHGPGILLCAVVLSRTLGDPYNGFAGYLKACVVSFITILVSFTVTMWASIIAFAQISTVNPVVLKDELPGIVIASLIYIVAGSPMAAWIILTLTNRFAPQQTDNTFKNAWATAILALAAFAAISILVEFFLRTADPMANWIDALASSKAPLLYLQHHLVAAFGFPLVTLIITQIPGLLVCASIIASRMGNIYYRRYGYPRVLLVSCLATAIPFLVLFLAVLLILRPNVR